MNALCALAKYTYALIKIFIEREVHGMKEIII